MDKKIMDKGWSTMRQLLDLEMPEKRRRFAWWWLGLLLLPLAGYGTWRAVSRSHTPVPAQENRAPVARTISPQTTPVLPVTPSADASVFNASAAAPKKAKHPLVRIPKFDSKKGIASSPAVQNPVFTENTLLLSSSTANAPLAPVSPKPAMLDALPGLLRPLDFVQAPIATPSVQPIAAALPSVTKVHYKAFEFGAMAAVSTERFSAVNGFAGGLSADWRWSPRWGLRSGLLYANYRPQVRYRPVASVASDSYASEVGTSVYVVDTQTGQQVTNITSAEAYGDSLASTVRIPVERLHRLEMPLSIFWQPNRRLKIFTGAVLSSTFSTNANKDNYSGQYLLNAVDAAAERSVNRLATRKIEKWGVDAQLGIGVSLSKRFELGASFKRPLMQTTFKKSDDVNLGFLTDGSYGASTLKASLFSLYGVFLF